MKIISVVGARPNFMKVAPIHRAFKNISHLYTNISHLICHTGQHYDEKMSKVFFDDLELPEPDFYLGVGSGSHAEQTAKVMIEFETVLLNEKPDAVLVVGDVNSTIACTLVASKLHIKTIHVEAGLRSGDRTMPEEINRLLTDSISDFLFVTEKSGMENLKREGVDESKIFFVGNVMIDSLAYYLPKADKSNILTQYELNKSEYVLVTLHRPSNVDDIDQLKKLFNLLNKTAERRKVIFPIHPRTRNNLTKFGIEESLNKNIILTDPIGYIDFLALTKNAELILTDSGGIQEESTYLGVQCITLRTTTERPVTVEVGTNQLLGNDLEKAEQAVQEILEGKKKEGSIPEKWDGKTAERIVDTLLKAFVKR
ncbi:MAG: UDP-N-acetylglucosamine 2-epimerase (non-hydrolyzing) [Melioribacteraceae bacterium]|nr:UDP-N-acetylglucosamine 2-epimerase (non-hydrolyzing) [Melioribacteraceae bacterium]